MKEVVNIIISLILLIITGCVSTERKVDYSNMKQSIVIFPAINNTDKKYFKKEIYRIDKLSIRNFLNKLSDSGYTIIDIENIKLNTFNLSYYSIFKSNEVPELFKKIPSDFSLLISIDSYEPTNIGTSKFMTVTTVLVKNDISKIIWTNTVSDSQWQGLIGGPSDILISSIMDDDSPNTTMSRFIEKLTIKSLENFPYIKNSF